MFKIWDSEGGEEEPVEKQVVLGGIIPGKRYRVSCEVECDSERDILSDDDDLIISTITPPCKFNFLLKSRKLLKEKTLCSLQSFLLKQTTPYS